jgi:hypothetical protein
MLCAPRVEEASIDHELQPLVGIAAFAGIEIVLLGPSDLPLEVPEQNVEVLDHAAHIIGVELQRLLQFLQDAYEIDDKPNPLLDPRWSDERKNSKSYYDAGRERRAAKVKWCSFRARRVSANRD